MSSWVGLNMWVFFNVLYCLHLPPPRASLFVMVNIYSANSTNLQRHIDLLHCGIKESRTQINSELRWSILIYDINQLCSVLNLLLWSADQRIKHSNQSYVHLLACKMPIKSQVNEFIALVLYAVSIKCHF